RTQCVSPRGPPPLAGHTLPVDQKDRGREGESGRVGEGHKEKAILSVCLHGESRSGRGTQREAKLSVFHPEGRLPWRVTRYLSIRRIEGEKGRGGEWVSGRVVEWVRDTKRSQTQSVSPRKPPPLAGHTLPDDQKDRERKEESGRVSECGTQREAKLSVFHPEGRLPWWVTRYLSIRSIEGERGRVGEWVSGRVGEGHKEKPNSECFTQKAASPGGSHVTCRSEGERERRGEWESGRGTQRESHTQCVSPRGEKEWQRDTKRSRTTGVSTTGPRERVWEEG